MTTKDYLETATGVDMRIASLNERIEELRCKAENITPSYGSGTGGSSVPKDKISDSVECITDLEAEIKCIRDEFVTFRHRVECEIQRIPDNVYATLLEEKYIKGKKWGDVAEKLGYSDEKHVRESLHSKALSEFDKITPENTRFVPSILQRKEV